MVPQQEAVDLTSPEAVDRSQHVYDRITSGEVLEVTVELDRAHGHSDDWTCTFCGEDNDDALVYCPGDGHRRPRG